MIPTNPQLSPSLNPYYWSPSHVTRRLRDSAQKTDASTVEPCYFYESYDGFAYLDVELPGVKKRNIAVEVNGNNLCVTGKRFRIDRDAQMKDRDANQEPDLSFVYFLQMRLGSDADANHISASCYEDGILTLAIPIKSTLVTRKIPIDL